MATCEKNFIYEWVEQQLNDNNKKISCKALQTKMKEQFGRLRAQNDLKNTWNARKKQINNQAKKAVYFEDENDPLHIPMSNSNSLFFQPTETTIATTASATASDITLGDIEWALDYDNILMLK
jgi:hypothetical protein